MTTLAHLLAVIAVLLVIGSVGFAALWFLGESDAQEREKQIRRSLGDADTSITAEHAKARRAMNKAAGQSWRNLVE